MLSNTLPIAKVLCNLNVAQQVKGGHKKKQNIDTLWFIDPSYKKVAVPEKSSE